MLKGVGLGQRLARTPLPLGIYAKPTLKTYLSRYSTASTMPSSSETEAIVKQLFDRPLPPLEPGTTVYDSSLTKRIANLPEHQFVVACKLETDPS